MVGQAVPPAHQSRRAFQAACSRNLNPPALTGSWSLAILATRRAEARSTWHRGGFQPQPESTRF